ncbi:MAG: phage holin family protein [Desulfobacterales bacterium]
MLNTDNRSTASLLSDLVSEVTALMRQEMLLAKTEISEKINQLGLAGASLATGGAVLFAGFLVLLSAAVLGLALVVPAWLAALLIGAVVAIIGGVMLMKGLHDLRAEELAPRRTIQSLKRDKQLAQEHIGG